MDLKELSNKDLLNLFLNSIYYVEKDPDHAQAPQTVLRVLDCEQEILKRMNQSIQKKEFKGFEVIYKPTGEKVTKTNYRSFFVFRQFPDVIPLYFVSEEEADKYQQDVWTRSFRECEIKPKNFFVDQEGRLMMEYYDNIEWEMDTCLVPEDYFEVRWL